METTSEEFLDKRTVNFLTSCEDCIFRNGKRCHLNRISKFNAKGMVEVSKEGINIIQGVCNAKRDSNWVYNEVSMKERKKQVELECQIQTAFIAISRSDKETKKILNKFGSIKDIYIKPKQIIIVTVYNGVDVNTPTSKDYIEHTLIKPSDLTLSESQLIDLAIDRVNTTYFTCWTDGTKNMNFGFINKVNKLMFNDLRKLVMARMTNGFNGLTVLTSVSKMFYNNRGMPIYDKVIEAAEYQNNKEEVVYDVS